MGISQRYFRFARKFPESLSLAKRKKSKENAPDKKSKCLI